MLKPLLLALLTFSLTFSIVGEQCPQFQEHCIENACPKAKGELNEYGICVQGEEFDPEAYAAEIDVCNFAYEYCVENDGVVKNMSCCGPVLILLGALTLAVKYST